MKLWWSFVSALSAVGLEIGLALLIATAYALHRQADEYRGLSTRAERAADDVAEIDAVGTLVERANFFHHDFIVHGKSDSEAAFSASAEELRRRLAGLPPRFRGDPEFSEKIERLRNVVTARLETTRAGVMVKRRLLNGESGLPLRVDDAGPSGREIRALADELRAGTQARLVEEGRRTARAGRELLDLLLAGLAAAGGVILAASLARRWSFARLKARNRRLQLRSILLDTILNSMSEALVVIDEKGVFTHYNAAAQRVIGTKVRSVGTKGDAELMGFRDAETGRFLALEELPFTRALRGHQIDDVEMQVMNETHPDGLYVSVSSRFLQDIDGRIGGALVVLKDISRRKEVERQWIAAREAAVEASKMKSDFLAAMSHEIRTPMNGVIGMTTLLADTELSSEQGDYVGTIKRSAESLLMLINDILDHSKIEAGKVTLDPKPFDLEFLARDVVEMFRATTREKNIGLDLVLEGGTSWTFTGDQGRVRQILVNLVGNAVKFTEKGFVSLVVTSTETIDRKRRLQFEIKDTGAGMNETERSSLFQKYFQAGSGKKFGGTGLGLSICKQLVDLMGGRIGVESVPDVGSNFWFVIDLEPCAAELVAATTNAKFEALFSGRVLVVEDQPVNQRVASSYLEKLGLKVDLASNGRLGLEKMLERPYDLIFMDCQMPVMTGYEATREARRLEAGGERRTIVALTAEGTSGERDACFEAGMDDFLTKPLELNALVALLNRRLKPSDGAIDTAAFAKLKDYVVNDQSLATVLIAEFAESAPALIESMRAGVTGADLQAVSEAAHALKSSSAALGARRMSALCRDVEDATALDGTMMTRINEIEIEFSKTLTELRLHSATATAAKAV